MILDDIFQGAIPLDSVGENIRNATESLSLDGHQLRRLINMRLALAAKQPKVRDFLEVLRERNSPLRKARHGELRALSHWFMSKQDEYMARIKFRYTHARTIEDELLKLTMVGAELDPLMSPADKRLPQHDTGGKAPLSLGMDLPPAI